MRVDDSEIDWQDSGDTALHDGVPFTGDVVETTANGIVVSLTSYVDGTQSGRGRIWYPDGVLREEWRVENGLAVGLHRRWHPNGRLAEEWLFGDRGGQVEHREWDPEGDPLTSGSP